MWGQWRKSVFPAIAKLLFFWTAWDGGKLLFGRGIALIKKGPFDVLVKLDFGFTAQEVDYRNLSYVCVLCRTLSLEFILLLALVARAYRKSFFGRLSSFRCRFSGQVLLACWNPSSCVLCRTLDVPGCFTKYLESWPFHALLGNCGELHSRCVDKHSLLERFVFEYSAF